MIGHVRTIAQTIRHAPLLRSLTPLWDAVRQPYLDMMKRLGGGTGIPVAIAGIGVRLHPDFATQNWETVESEPYRAFVSALRPGDVVYDVGAHIGTYTLVALDRIGPAGRVIAYEPHALTGRYLLQHVQWNGGSDNVVIRSVCCGAREGTANFYCLPGRTEGTHGLLPVHGFDETVVDVTTLDAEVGRLGAIPTVIKIDVEGAEWDVLQGAEQTLRRYHPQLSLSLHPRALASTGTSPESVLNWLSQLGYTHQVISVDHEVHVVLHASHPADRPGACPPQ